MATRSSVSVSESLPETTVGTAGGGCAEKPLFPTSWPRSVTPTDSLTKMETPETNLPFDGGA